MNIEEYSLEMTKLWREKMYIIEKESREFSKKIRDLDVYYERKEKEVIEKYVEANWSG